MKITDLKVFSGQPMENWVFLKLYTDMGSAVWASDRRTGDQTLDLAIRRAATSSADPPPERLWLKLHKALLRAIKGMSAIEQACWDILGKVWRSVWQLFGSKHHNRLRVYANGWYKGPRTPEDFAHRALQMVEQGYNALKFDPFGGAYQQISKESETLAVEIVAAVRKAVGSQVDLLIEAHDRLL